MGMEWTVYFIGIMTGVPIGMIIVFLILKLPGH